MMDVAGLPRRTTKPAADDAPSADAESESEATKTGRGGCQQFANEGYRWKNIKKGFNIKEI